MLELWDELQADAQNLFYEVARQVAIAQPPAWEQLEDNPAEVLPLEDVKLPPYPAAAPAAAAAPGSPPSLLLQRARDALVEALAWDPAQAGPANAPDPRLAPFRFPKAYLEHGPTPATVRERCGRPALRAWGADSAGCAVPLYALSAGARPTMLARVLPAATSTVFAGDCGGLGPVHRGAPQVAAG